MEFKSLITQAKDLEQIKKDLTGGISDSYDLGFLFFSEHSRSQASEIVNMLRAQTKVKHLLGCTCAGIIGTSSEIERQSAVTLILAKLPNVRIHPFFINQFQLEQLKSKDDWYNFFEVYPNENPKFLTLPDPFMLDMNLFLQGLNATYPGCPVIGGLASGASDAGDNLLFINQEEYSDGAIGVVLLGDFDVQTIVSQGCRPLGETYIVTKAEDNVIHELAGRPFLSILKEVLDKASIRDKLLMQEAIFVGIAMDEYKHPLKRGDFLIRAVIGLDQNTGSGAIADYVKPGQTVQFHVRDAVSATEDLNELLTLQQKNV